MPRRFLNRFSLTTKMVLISVATGLVVWAVADYFELTTMKSAFQAHLEDMLEDQALEDRNSFNNYVRAHSHAAVLYSSQKGFMDYLGVMLASCWEGTIFHTSPPTWLPPPSVMRLLVKIRYALLLDEEGNVREVYMDMPGKLPETLLYPTVLLRQMSHDQGLMTSIEGSPFLINSRTVSAYDGTPLATLMLASPIDSEFLTASQGYSSRQRIVALVQGEPGEIVASNRPELFPRGARVDSLEGRYLITGKRYFDYGASDLQLGFTTIIPTEDIQNLARMIILKDRIQHSIRAVMLIVAFTLMMAWVTRRIERLDRRVTEFSEEALGSGLGELEPGDQIDRLEERVQMLTTEVRRKTAELEASNTELEAFSYSVSHDLRAPLRALDGFSQAIMEEYANHLDETGMDYLRRVRAASNRMAQLIDDLLTLSRITRSEMTRLNVDLSEMAREITEALGQAEPDRDVEFEVQGGVTAHGDPRLLRIALGNLLDNSWKFTRGREKANVQFGLREGGDGKVYFVKDNGAGFNPSYKEKLFAAFQRLHGADEFEGSGIGLATVKRVVNRHDGRVWAEGEEGKGATFYFTLG